jgi:hypothetical protein
MPMRLGVALLAAAAWWPALSEPEAAGSITTTTKTTTASSAGATLEEASPPQEAVLGGAPAVHDAPNASEEAASMEVAPSEEAVPSEEASLSEEAAAEDAAAAAAAANATEQARLDLEAVFNASELFPSSANLRGSGWWGHGVSGETCCMCSRRWGWTTILYAAEDYSHSYGVHSALWQCQHSCEVECHKKGGHQFGCYDEQHIVIMDRLYGHRSGYTILHDDHYGDIC